MTELLNHSRWCRRQKLDEKTKCCAPVTRMLKPTTNSKTLWMCKLVLEIPIVSFKMEEVAELFTKYHHPFGPFNSSEAKAYKDKTKGCRTNVPSKSSWLELFFFRNFFNPFDRPLLISSEEKYVNLWFSGIVPPTPRRTTLWRHRSSHSHRRKR